MTQKYEPTLQSVRQHQVPTWFHDAKFGIFIHWSLSSVPAFAVTGEGDIQEVIAKHGIKWHNANNPYAEWYLNTLRIKGSPTEKYHRENYGDDYPYENFAKEFNKAVEKWDPDKWAELFKSVGAKYVVLVTKHHDGFLLWPSSKPNPINENYHSERDLVGELTNAVKSHGMRMGLYYSGALDWSFNEVPITGAVSFLTNGPTRRDYVEYVNYHFRELIDKYEPTILWNDIGYPPGTNVNELFAYFYNKTPDGLVNDRWLQFPRKIRGVLKSWPVRNIVEFIAGIVVKTKGLEQNKPPHSDYATPEYATRKKISERKWESVRGIGNSFGYNRMENENDYLSGDEAVRMLVDIVSKNGNLLLNLGPMADGTIPDGQLQCIRGIGDWLETNGDAIYGTRPWIEAEGSTSNDIEIRFTRKDDALYAILLDTPKESEIVIDNLKPMENSTIKLLGSDSELKWERHDAGVKIYFPENLPQSPAHSLAISPLPIRG